MKNISAIIVLSFFSMFSGLAYSDNVDKALAVCSVFDKTGMLSESCDISGWNRSVDVKIDTNGSEARKICNGVSSLLEKQGVYFIEKQWKLRIYSPFSNGNTIATCNLPKR